MDNEPTYCTHCGAKLGEGLQFCTSCGEPVVKTESCQTMPEEIEPPRIHRLTRGREVATFLVFMLATVAIVLGVAWYARNGGFNAVPEESVNTSYDAASTEESAATSNANPSTRINLPTDAKESTSNVSGNTKAPAETKSEQQPKKTTDSETVPSVPEGNVQSTKTTQVTQETPENQADLHAFEYTSSYAAELDVASLDRIVSSGPIASNDTVSSNAWAKAVRNSGELRVGGAKASMLFAYDDGSGQVRGFDVALYQLLARYIFGDQNAYTLTRISTDTREQVLQDGTVDVVCATYTITPERAQRVSFAGPYFQTRQGMLVRAGESRIQGIGDLSGRIVGVEEGSVAEDLVAQYVADVQVQTFGNDAALMRALDTGAIDAYVTDSTILMGDIVQYPSRFKLLGEFGPIESYGIGLPHGTDGVAFVNEFLKKIEADGTWSRLWQTCLGKRVGIANTPDPPTVG